MTKQIRMVEVGARDGLQNEPSIKTADVDHAVRVRSDFLINLADAGFTDIEAGAFVRAEKVPQMQATEKVVENIQNERPDLWKNTNFWCLVPNRRGLARAVSVGVKNIAFFIATSDTFSRKNINMSVDESLAEVKAVIKEAKQNSMQIRGYISTVWGCPYEGETDIQRAVKISGELLDEGVVEVSLGDTIGVATPDKVSKVMQAMQKDWPLAGHFHDTRGTALANCLQAIAEGITVLDSSAGGLGGCPYAKGATGNVASEDLLYMLSQMGLNSQVDIEKLCLASEKLGKDFGINLPSKYFRAWQANKQP